MISLSRSEPNLSAYLSIRESPFPVEILSILLYMLSLELLEMEGSLDFLLFHTDLKSEDSSVTKILQVMKGSLPHLVGLRLKIALVRSQT